MWPPLDAPVMEPTAEDMTVDQFSYIRIQPKTIDLQGINPTNSVVIPKSLALRSIVLGCILIYFMYMYQNVLQRKSATAKLRDSGASKGTQRARHRENEPFEILTGSFNRNPLHSKIVRATADK